LLPTGEGAQRAAAEVGDTEQVEGLLDAATHLRGREAELLHGVGDLLLHDVGDEPREGVLPDVADGGGELPRGEGRDVAAVDEDASGADAAGEAGDEVV